jgi:hypothetical protein
MNTCGTCKYLGEEIKEYDWREREYRATGFHACDLIDLRRYQKKVPPPLAYTEDASDYKACLCVRHEFGCAEWSAVELGEGQ